MTTHGTPRRRRPSPIAAKSSAADLGSAALAEPGALAKGVAEAVALAARAALAEPGALAWRAAIPRRRRPQAAQLGAAKLAEPGAEAPDAAASAQGTTMSSDLTVKSRWYLKECIIPTHVQTKPFHVFIMFVGTNSRIQVDANVLG